MGRCDQLFRIRALLAFKARLEGIRRLVEDTGSGCQMAAAGATGTLPNCLCLTDHVTSPLLVLLLQNLDVASAVGSALMLKEAAERNRQTLVNRPSEGNCRAIFEIGSDDLYANGQTRVRPTDRDSDRRQAPCRRWIRDAAPQSALKVLDIGSRHTIPSPADCAR